MRNHKIVHTGDRVCWEIGNHVHTGTVQRCTSHELPEVKEAETGELVHPRHLRRL